MRMVGGVVGSYQEYLHMIYLSFSCHEMCMFEGWWGCAPACLRSHALRA